MWLIESLKVEQINAPVEHAADPRAPILCSVLGAGDRRTFVVTAVSGPASFYNQVSYGISFMKQDSRHTTVHEVDAIDTATDVLNMLQRSSHIVEVCPCRITDLLKLPVCKTVAKTVTSSAFVPVFQSLYSRKINAASNYTIHTTILPAIPAIRSSNLVVGKQVMNF